MNRNGQGVEPFLDALRQLSLSEDQVEQIRPIAERWCAAQCDEAEGASHWRATLARLKESEQMLQFAQSAAEAGAWAWEIDAQKLRWSQGLYELFGVTPDEVEATLENFYEFVHPDDRQRVRSLLERLGEFDELHLEFRIIRRDGQTRWFESRGKLIEPDDAPRRMIGILLDITDLKLAEAHLRDLNEALEQRTAQAERRTQQLRMLAARLGQAEQRERRRLANVLHDHLQQLLFAAKMKLTVVRNRSSEPERSNVQQALDLVGESIAASRSLTAELSPAVLHDMGLIAAIQWLARDMQQKHGLDVQLDVEGELQFDDSDLNATLFGMVRELLFNVVKHAEAQHARISLAQSDPQHLRITVSDDGRGFELEKVMADGSEGYGLANVRERVQLIDGQFEVDSAPGRGARITLTVPHEQQDRAPDAVERETASGHAASRQREPGRRLRVLVVDDHAIVRKGLISMLEPYEDIEVVGEANNGEQAVSRVARGDVDVVLMDVSMPVLNGIEATRQITAHDPHATVIGLSMHEHADMAAAMHNAGASAYFTKGGPTEELLGLIRGAAETVK